MIGCKLSVRDVKTWFLRLLGISPARLLYIGGSDVLPPPLPRAEEERAVAAMTTDILPGTPAYIGRGSYYVADPDAVAALMANYNPAS